MTNPNCEYNANFIGIHTLAQWSKSVSQTLLWRASNEPMQSLPFLRCSIDGTLPYSSANDVVSADIKLEIQNDAESDETDPVQLPTGVYHPDNALVAAIKDWIPEFTKQKTVSDFWMIGIASFGWIEKVLLF